MGSLLHRSMYTASDCLFTTRLFLTAARAARLPCPSAVCHLASSANRGEENCAHTCRFAGARICTSKNRRGVCVCLKAKIVKEATRNGTTLKRKIAWGVLEFVSVTLRLDINYSAAAGAASAEAASVVVMPIISAIFFTSSVLSLLFFLSSRRFFASSSRAALYTPSSMA